MNRRATRVQLRSMFVLPVLLLPSAGCSSVPALQLQPGTTTRSECLFALGLPAMAMDDGAVLVYLTAPGDATAATVHRVLHASTAVVPSTGDGPFAERIPDPVRLTPTGTPCTTVVLRFDRGGVLQRATVVDPP